MSDPVHNLPADISAITTQKKNNHRYSIFIDDVFLVGVDESTLLDFNLKKGTKITVALYRNLQRAEGRHAAKSYLLKILSRRDHARKELFDKARHKDYPVDVINDVLDELDQKDFIDDREFAGIFAREKNNLNNWGPYKIKAHLRKKGIAKGVAEQAIEQTFSEVDLKERYQKLIHKRQRHFLREKNTLKRKKKVLSYLRQKGYRTANIYKYLDKLMEVLKKNEKI